MIGEVWQLLVDTALQAVAVIHAAGVAQRMEPVQTTHSMAAEAVTMVVAEAIMAETAIVAKAPLD